mgnify:CR=1 FL=1
MVLTFKSSTPGVEREKGFTVTSDNIKQVIFSVRTARNDGLFVDWQKGNAMRVAAAACGVVDEKEIAIDIAKMPNPCDWDGDYTGSEGVMHG